MANLNEYVRKYLDKLKVSDTEHAKSQILPVVEELREIIASQDPRFDTSFECRGSIYEKAKILSADEFDYDLPITALQIEDAPTEVPRGFSKEYATYTLSPRQRSWQNMADGDTLSAERVVQTFSGLVKNAVDKWNSSHGGFRLEFETNHPAVTIKFKKHSKTIYDVDLAPVIQVQNWPQHLTREWQHRPRKAGWPATSLINSIISDLPVYLVPKFPRHRQPLDHSHRLWRFAFNNAEKKLLNDPDSTTPNNCRKDVLRVLKGCLHDLNWPGLRSYHLKTLMLRQFEKTNNWGKEQIGKRLVDAVKYLKTCVTNESLVHYFIAGVNIISRINQEEKRQLLAKLEKFCQSPEAILAGLVGIQTSQVSQGFKIYVDDLNGKRWSYDVRNDYTIEQLKKLIADDRKIGTGQFRLVFNGHNLDTGTVKSNGIIAGSVINLVGRLRGG